MKYTTVSKIKNLSILRDFVGDVPAKLNIKHSFT